MIISTCVITYQCNECEVLCTLIKYLSMVKTEVKTNISFGKSFQTDRYFIKSKCKPKKKT